MGTCKGGDAAAWRDGTRFETDRLLTHALAGDTRPFYAHQANLAGDATLRSVLEPALRIARTHLDHQLKHPSLTQIAALRSRTQRASTAIASGAVRVERIGRSLQLISSRRVSIPVSRMTPRGEEVRWLDLVPGRPVTVPAER